MLKKIFVIGSNSFTGNRFINYSLDKNIKIIGVSRSKEPNEVLLSYKKNKNIGNFSFFKLNVNNEMKKIISLIESFKPDAIVNYSAQGDVRHSWENPIQWFNTNHIHICPISSFFV